MTGTSPDTCKCGERVSPDRLVADEDISERRARAFARHQAQAASGVVVSARDVKALADDLDRRAGRYREDIALGTRVAADDLRSLLRGPATDAAPTGEAQGGGKTCGRCYGSRQIINDDVRVALVRPISCPECVAVSLPEGGEQR